MGSFVKQEIPLPHTQEQLSSPARTMPTAKFQPFKAIEMMSALKLNGLNREGNVLSEHACQAGICYQLRISPNNPERFPAIEKICSGNFFRISA